MLSDINSLLSLREKKMCTIQFAEESLQQLWIYLYLVYFVGNYLSWQVKLSFKFIQMTKILTFQILSPRNWLILKIYFTCRFNIQLIYPWINLISWAVYLTTRSKVAILILPNLKFVHGLNLKEFKVQQYSMGITNQTQFYCASIQHKIW